METGALQPRHEATCRPPQRWKTKDSGRGDQACRVAGAPAVLYSKLSRTKPIVAQVVGPVWNKLPLIMPCTARRSSWARSFAPRRGTKASEGPVHSALRSVATTASHNIINASTEKELKHRLAGTALLSPGNAWGLR